MLFDYMRRRRRRGTGSSADDSKRSRNSVSLKSSSVVRGPRHRTAFDLRLAVRISSSLNTYVNDRIIETYPPLHHATDAPGDTS